MDDGTWVIASNIDGWLTYAEADLLWRYNNGVWAEVGSWMGRSTVILASKSKGYAIDWFKGSSEHGAGTDTYDDFMRNTQLVKGNITVLNMDYHDAVDKIPKLDLLFLDAEHTYEATKDAFDLYAPKVKKGGYIILHDVWGLEHKREGNPWVGVTEFVDNDLIKDKRFKHVEDADRSACFKKL